MDKLEKFIKNNRTSLDIYDPSPEIWKGIRKSSSRSNKTLIRWMWAAAMITIVLGISFTAYNLSVKGRQMKISGSALQKEIKETEYFYNTLVNSLYLQAKPLLTDNPDIEKELNLDLARIDKICTEIKDDLKDNVANQEVIEALIQNYTIKIRLLEDMLTTLKENENNTEKSKSNEL